MKYKRILKRLIKNPVIFKEICLYLKNDLLASLGVYRYDYPILFVDGLAKSGSSWVGNMLAMIPGYNLRAVNDPGNVTYNHDICESVFSSLPKNKFSVMKLHTRYSEENFRIIKKYVPKFIITYRDLRDVCVARYFHIKVDPKHRHHELYKSLNIDEGMMHCIDNIKEDFVPWVREWIDIASQYKDVILPVKYEDLNRDTVNTLKRIMKFYNIDLTDDFIFSLAETKITKEVNLGKALSRDLPGRLRSTARKGVVGDWKNWFDKRHKERFKEIAGDLLVELQYEKDNKWCYED